MSVPNVVVKLKYYPLNSRLENVAKRRAFYSGGISDDYLRYIDKGCTARNDYKDYVDYVANPEKSSGVFGKDGLLSKVQKKELRQKLKTTQSVIWDMVISFTEEFGNKNMSCTETAIDLLHLQLDKFFRKSGLNPSNVTWYAGLHKGTENKHIHVSFFEREPLFVRQKDKSKHYRNGKLIKAGIESFKLNIEQYFSQSGSQLIQKRKDLTALTDRLLAPNTDYNSVIKNKFINLYNLIPKEGHISYESENMQSVRRAIDGLTSFMLRENTSLQSAYSGFKSELLQRDEQTRELCAIHKIKNTDDYLVTDKAIADLFRRLGNKVIRHVLRLKQRDKKAVQIGKRKRYESRKFGSLIEQSFRLSAMYEEECIWSFKEFLAKLRDAEFEREKDEQEM